MAELADRVRAAHPGALVISEMELGDRRPIEEWGHDAQWADELPPRAARAAHRRARRLLQPYGKVADLARAYGLEPAERLVVCAQNHDQIGNRAVRRPAARPSCAGWPRRACSSRRRCRCCSWARSTARRAPFQFFTDHDDPAIAAATREGRRKEFARFAAFAGRRRARSAGARDLRALEARIPGDGDDELRAFYRELLALRAQAPAPTVETDGRRGASGAAGPARRRRARRRLREPDGRAASMSGPSDGGLARRAVPARRDLGRRGHELLAVLRERRAVELCLFDDDGANETRIELTERTAFNWHCYLPGVGPGPALRLPRPRPVRAGARACASTRRSC